MTQLQREHDAKMEIMRIKRNAALLKLEIAEKKNADLSKCEPHNYSLQRLWLFESWNSFYVEVDRKYFIKETIHFIHHLFSKYGKSVRVLTSSSAFAASSR